MVRLMKRTLLLGSLSLLCALAAANLANAATISGSMQEPFDDATYPNAQVFANTPATGFNGGTGWNPSGTTNPNTPVSAAWGAVLNAGTNRVSTSPGLTATATGYLAASGNKMTLDGVNPSNTQNIGRNLGGQTIDAGTTYFSLQMSKGNDTPRTINMAFFNGGTERFALGQIRATAGNTGGNIGMLMNNANPAGLLPLPATPIAMGINVPHLLVGRIDWNTSGTLVNGEVVTLWVDPASVVTRPPRAPPIRRPAPSS